MEHRQRFSTLIQTPEIIGEEDIQALQAISEKYPWFAAPHFIVAHHHKSQGLYSYQRMLRQASLYAGDRSVLYAFLQGAEPRAEEIKIETIKDSQPIAADLNELVSTESSSVEDLQGAEVHQGQEKQGDPKENNEATNETNASEKAEIPYDYIHSMPSAEMNEETLDNQDLTKAVQEGLEGNKTLPEDIRTEENENVPQPQVTYDPIEALTPLIQKKTINESVEDEALLATHTLYDPEKELLKYLEEEHEEAEVSESHQTGDTDEDHDFLYWLNHTKAESEEVPRIPDVKAKLQRETSDSIVLLESFIRNRPQMQKPKLEFFKAETAARNSERDDSMIVSESLAQLFIKQGHLEKAIEVYRKLILQNPLRKPYFAARILEIKQQHNS